MSIRKCSKTDGTCPQKFEAGKGFISIIMECMYVNFLQCWVDVNVNVVVVDGTYQNDCHLKKRALTNFETICTEKTKTEFVEQ